MDFQKVRVGSLNETDYRHLLEGADYLRMSKYHIKIICKVSTFASHNLEEISREYGVLVIPALKSPFRTMPKPIPSKTLRKCIRGPAISLREAHQTHEREAATQQSHGKPGQPRTSFFMTLASAVRPTSCSSHSPGRIQPPPPQRLWPG